MKRDSRHPSCCARSPILCGQTLDSRISSAVSASRLERTHFLDPRSLNWKVFDIGLPARDRLALCPSLPYNFREKCHTTSNTRTPTSFGIGASHGEACKAARVSEIPCCHRTSIED